MIYRIDVRTGSPARGGEATVDPLGEAVRHQIAEFGMSVGRVQTRRVFLIDTDASREQVDRIAKELLADPVVEEAEVVSGNGAGNGSAGGRLGLIEIHLKPGVMDPVAASTEMAVRDMGLPVREIRTGRAFLIEGAKGPVPRAELEHIASRVLANGVIESVHFEPFVPAEFARGHDHAFSVRHVPVRELNDEQLQRLSREGHLFLSLAEMKAVQAYYHEQGREPTDVELETVAQTWSEHCVHKTLKSAVDVEVRDAAGKVVGSRRYKNLIKETIFDSTVELMARSARAGAGDFCLSVFKDNAGVVAFDETDAVCFKVETHNHPSAIEPYGGSATGAGGVIRDILGTGLGAKPVANTDVFCVAFPDTFNGGPHGRTLPKGVIHPRRVLQQVVAGVRDYGNRMGIPTVNGAVYFDDRYVGNPLVFCGCVGIIRRERVDKAVRDGDRIVLMGGRTGRDGIHGATFSSAELTDTHADEFSHAVQIGNAITEKKVADVILRARDRGLFTAVTDCGAGGLSSAVGEMGEKVGALVELDRVPLKYAGLRYDEVWISEAQERMVLSVPILKVEELLALAASEDVEATVIGHFGEREWWEEDTRYNWPVLRLKSRDREVGQVAMKFLHDGIPMPTRKAVVTEARGDAAPKAHGRPFAGFAGGAGTVRERLLSALAHPNVASKHWIIRQYDHEVQGGSVIKPLVGPLQVGPSDAAVLRPKLGSDRGVALGCGLAPHLTDPYEMALAAIDEAVRNVVAVGADPGRLAILDNFCWPSVDDEKTMGDLVRTCEACRDAALAYGIPFISGKDSLHNQFTNSETGEVIRIPNTLLVSAIAVLEDVRKCVTMDLKRPGNHLYLVAPGEGDPLAKRPAVHRAVAGAIAAGLVESCHDLSEGGALVAVAEMAIAADLGLAIPQRDGLDEAALFGEEPGRYLIEVSPEKFAEASNHFAARRPDVTLLPFASVLEEPHVVLSAAGEPVADVAVPELRAAWRGTLDW